MLISKNDIIHPSRYERENVMRRLILKYLFLGFVAVFFSITHSAFAQQTLSTEFVIHYRNEFTFALCLFVLIVSSWLGMKLPADKEEEDLPQSIKFVTALLGGILAFIYCLYKDNSLTLLNPIWIAVASIILPVTILSLRTKFKGYTKTIDLPKNGD